MLRLFQLLEYAFLVALFLEAAQSFFKRFVLLNPYLWHPITTPLLFLDSGHGLALSLRSLTGLTDITVTWACTVNLSRLLV